jgi:aminoglycoside 2'-N-acetyltransferase I
VTDQAFNRRLRVLRTPELSEAEIAAIRRLMRDAFGTDDEHAFTDDDWKHSIGGIHFVLDLADEIVTHAALVERELQIGGQPLRTGYVEAVATAPAHEGIGHGSQVMHAVTEHIRAHFELGALGTGRHHFYERLGWQTWHGPAFVRGPDGPVRTPEEEGYILVLRTPTSPPFALTDTISCDWRDGDVW